MHGARCVTAGARTAPNLPAAPLPDPDPQEEIYSSSYAAAAYLASINFQKKVRAWATDGDRQTHSSRDLIPQP